MEEALPWPVKLFRASVLKQAKWRVLSDLVGDTRDRDGLDLGSDNGVISWLFRRGGGRWRSADLDPRAVESIRSLVGSEVYRVDGETLPFPDASLDVVVVVDMLEHVPRDAALLREIARTLRSDGVLVLNVPHRKRGALLPPLRDWLGLDDAWHGHLRPGYRREELRALLPDGFRVEAERTYNRFFSESLDIALNAVLTRSTGAESSQKGVVVTGEDLERNARRFRLWRFVYPFAWLWARLDLLLPWTRGYMLALRARKGSASSTLS